MLGFSDHNKSPGPSIPQTTTRNVFTDGWRIDDILSLFVQRAELVFTRFKLGLRLLVDVAFDPTVFRLDATLDIGDFETFETFTDDVTIQAHVSLESVKFDIRL